MEMWQIVMSVVGGVCFFLYFRRRATRLSTDE
jgi:hypothetical protein